jgi:ferredoxin--NADP+ reductase
VTSTLGSAARPVRIAIIGAGPSGFYAAGALLQQRDYHVTIDIFDRLPTPYGLVRYGVAPDHQKIKSVTKVYERTVADPRVRYLGNVGLGKDISHEELRKYYDQIIYAVGAPSDRKLGVPGEDLEGSFSATEFVAWYNGHPDFSDRDFDLSKESVAVIGVGNVAMDVARILASSPDELAKTDIADYALEKLRTSQVKKIHVIARRGPVQAKFTNPEIKELGELELADVIVKPEDLELDPYSEKELEQNTAAAKNLKILRQYAERGATGKPRQILFHFLRSPVELIGENGAVVAIKLERNTLRPTETGYLQSYGTGEFETLPVGLVFRSIGYRGVPIPGVPFNERRGIIPNDHGRVIDPETNKPVPGEYVVGWAKRGPTGIIGTNKPDAVETVQKMLEDIPQLQEMGSAATDPGDIKTLLDQRNVAYVTFEDWKLLDQLEQERGKEQGRPRVKFTSVNEMLEALRKHREASTQPKPVRS